MDLLLEAPPFEQDPPPPKAMEHDWLEWWDEIGQNCEATPYVADGLKVTKWLDFAAETAMGFLLCGDVLVLIKRYWMEQEVGWVEWSSAVLSCIPVLGKIGGLALRGVAGAAKWFLRSRHLRHLAQGSRYLDDARRLHRRFAGWISNCEPEDNHHLWPFYLGGHLNGQTVRIPRGKHRQLHSEMDNITVKVDGEEIKFDRRQGRRFFCGRYQAGLLTSQQIWQALDQFYANNYPEYHPAWQNAYPQPLENLSFLAGCQEPNFAHCICGGR
jgi:hypothetical protein